MKIMVTRILTQASTAHSLLLGTFKKTTLLFSFAIFVLTASAQNNILVKGRITDERNLPVNGASVILKGTTIGAATNENGELLQMKMVNSRSMHLRTER